MCTRTGSCRRSVTTSTASSSVTPRSCAHSRRRRSNSAQPRPQPGNAQLDELVETGLRYGVDVARNGGEAATETLLAEQRTKLENALKKQAEAAIAKGVGTALR
jgi:hypothetical protein